MGTWCCKRIIVGNKKSEKSKAKKDFFIAWQKEEKKKDRAPNAPVLIRDIPHHLCSKWKA